MLKPAFARYRVGAHAQQCIFFSLVLLLLLLLLFFNLCSHILTLLHAGVRSIPLHLHIDTAPVDSPVHNGVPLVKRKKSSGRVLCLRKYS